MPNHVATNLVITGTREEVQRFIAASTVDGRFDFNGVYPMPEKIRNTISPVRIVTQEEYDRQAAEIAAIPEDNRTEWNRRPRGITQEMRDALVKEFGTDNWYDWAYQHYGTKWGAYRATPWTVSEDGTSAKTHYNTAWSPATPFFEKVSKDFQLTFTHYYADEGGGFVGSETIKDGDVISSENCSWDSPRGIEIREQVGYGPSEDEQVDPAEDHEA